MRMVNAEVRMVRSKGFQPLARDSNHVRPSRGVFPLKTLCRSLDQWEPSKLKRAGAAPIADMALPKISLFALPFGC